MQYVFYLIALGALLILVSYLRTFLRLRKLKIQYAKYLVQKADKVPTYLKELFHNPIRELETFGFKPCSYLEVRPMVKFYPPTTWEILLYHKTFKTYAKVGIRRPVEPVNLFDIEFYNLFQDNSMLLTMNGKQHGILDEIPNFIVQDIYTDGIELQWAVHQHKLKQLVASKIPCGLAPGDFALVLQRYIKNYINYLNKTGKISQVKGEELFQINWLAALKTAKKLVQSNKKAAGIVHKRRKKAQTDATLKLEIPIELEVEGFLRMEEQQQELLDGKSRTLLLLLSVILFVISYITQPGTHGLVILIAVLFFHEGGHTLAMKLFGYQDTSILFLPFLGAVATARKDDATLTQKFWVTLAGPLPGLILGIGLAIAAGGNSDLSWVREASWMLIVLNLFNLLPVYPLDGGKIVNMLLFSGFSYTDALFKMLGVFFLGLLTINQPRLLYIVMVVSMSIPQSFRSAKINSQLRQDIQQKLYENREHLLYSIFKKLKQLGYGNLPFSKRYVLVKQVIERHYESRSKWTTKVFLTIIYCVSLFGGILLSLQATILLLVSKHPHSFEHQQRLERIIDRHKN